AELQAAVIGLKLGTANYTRDIAATGNVIRDCEFGIAAAATTAAGTIVLSGNVVARSKRGAIVAFDDGKPISQDLLAAGLTS
ncbi:hypothetical protein J8J40_32440, partial [Mycobacterium tuberculosis]|nr:hypothetical protein [Mycobacterium tuberculosis]